MSTSTAIGDLSYVAGELARIEAHRDGMLGLRRKTARDARAIGMTVVEIADALGVTRQTVHKLLSD